jgi:hypothetical protein
MKRISLFILLLLLFACNQNTSSLLYDYKKLTTEADGKGGLLVLQSRDYVYIKTDKADLIGKLSVEELNSIFEKFYQNKINKIDFLYDFLNLKNEIPIAYFENLGLHKRLIKLDSNVLGQYRKNGISYLINNFTYKLGKQPYGFKNDNIDFFQKETVVYLFYTNHYDLIKDDYSGLSWFIQKKEFLLYW